MDHTDVALLYFAGSHLAAGIAVWFVLKWHENRNTTRKDKKR